jgi:NADH-quinone oxidoreductase subunit J
MEISAFIFYLFAAVLILAALKVITSRNPVHAALFLVLAFFSASAIWILLQAEFLAITLILVYVGAVMVLFLFVVMMLDLNLEKLRADFSRYIPVGLLVGSIIIVEMSTVLIYTFIGVHQPAPSNIESSGSNTRDLGRLIYSDYLYAFEVAGIILLVAMIAAVALTLRHRKDRKTQNISEQLRTRAQDRVKMVSMTSITPAQPTDTKK